MKEDRKRILLEELKEAYYHHSDLGGDLVNHDDYFDELVILCEELYDEGCRDGQA